MGDDILSRSSHGDMGGGGMGTQVRLARTFPVKKMDFKAQNLSENSRETQWSANMILKETASRD